MANLYDKASFIFTANAYSASRLFSIKPTNGNGDLIFYRASSCTRVNSSGVIEVLANDIPALNYSSSLSCPTLTLEPTRTNSLVQSNGFGTTWTLNATTVTSSQGISPDGTNNAWKLNETVGGSTTHDIRQASAITAVSQSRYVISAYVKPVERNQVAIQSDIGGASDLTKFNLTGTGSIYPASIQPGHTATISQVGNGWYRITDSVIANTSSVKFFAINLLSSSITTTPGDSYAGTNGTAGVYIYGAQIEAGGYVTSYIPTTTGAVTKIGDQYIISNSISSSMGITGTWFVNIKDNTAIASDNAAAGIYLGSNQNSGTSGDSILFRQGGGSVRAGIWLYTGSIQPVGGATYTPTTNNSKIAITWDSASRVSNIYDNGVRVVTSASFVPTTSPRWLRAGNSNPVGRTFNIDSMALFPTVLSDAECIALTT
jgi:hypothetical protein